MLKLRPESDTMLSLDALRFLAAMGVVLLHLGAPVLIDLRLRTIDHLEFLNLFVDIFFVISGVVISRIYGDRIGGWADYGDFLKRRFARLAPLHYLTLLFYVAAGVSMLLLGIRTSSPQTFYWPDLPGTVLFLHAMGGAKYSSFNFPSWSISAEMAMYVLFPVLMWIGRLRFLLLLITAASLGLLMAFPKDWWLLTTQFGVLRGLAGFCLGLFLARQRLPNLPNFLWIGAIAAFMVLGVAGVSTNLLWPLAYLIPVLAMGADNMGRPGAFTKGLAPLGQLTYSVYMLHMPVNTLLIGYLGQRALGLTGWAAAGWSLMCIGVVLVVGYLSFALFETPSRRWINGWGRRREP